MTTVVAIIFIKLLFSIDEISSVQSSQEVRDRPINISITNGTSVSVQWSHRKKEEFIVRDEATMGPCALMSHGKNGPGILLTGCGNLLTVQIHHPHHGTFFAMWSKDGTSLSRVERYGQGKQSHPANYLPRKRRSGIDRFDLEDYDSLSDKIPSHFVLNSE